MEQNKGYLNWTKVGYDVECYTNCFLCSIKDVDTKEVIIWEISDRKDDLDEIREFFNSFKGYLISFNGIHYDNCMIMFLLLNNYPTLELLIKTKEFSDIIITNQGEQDWWKDNRYKRYKYHNRWIDVDLFLYWSKMLRISKKISLKGLAIQLGYHTVQELPFDPAMHLNSEQIDELIYYNSVHDLGILDLLLTNMIEEVRLRQYIKKEYNLDCMSFDAPKIASEVLLKEYCESTNTDPRELRRIKFQYEKKLDLPQIDFKLDCFKKIYEGMSNCTTEYSNEVVLLEGNTKIKLTYGKGGLHSVNKNESYKENQNNYIVTSDIASLYPNLMINYKLLRFREVLDLFIRVKKDRIEAKKNKDKSKDALLKLILNSTSGLIDNEYSWLYYPEGAMKLRLTGQLILSLVIERLVLSGYQVISANTDGIECIVPKDKIEEYYFIVNKVGKEFNLEFEHEKYKQIIYQHINSYIAQTETKVKQKGLFVEKPELGNSTDYLIIPKALNAYYLNNTPVEQFVKEHKNILDFCCSQKVDKSYHIMWTDPNFVSSKQQRLNRFYASTNGGYIYKCRNGKQNHLLKESGVQIYNNHVEEFPTNINYKFYISQINKIIMEINNKNQLELF